MTSSGVAQQFDLEFDSPIHQEVLTVSAAYPYNTVDGTLHAVVHFGLTRSGNLDSFVGKASSESLTFTPAFSKANCENSPNPSASKFQVVGFQLPWDLNLFLFGDDPQPRPMSITIDVGKPLEHVGIDCPGAGISVRIGDIAPGYWEANFSILHRGEAATSWPGAEGSVYVIPLKYQGPGELVAEKTYPGVPTPILSGQYIRHRYDQADGAPCASTLARDACGRPPMAHEGARAAAAPRRRADPLGVMHQSREMWERRVDGGETKTLRRPVDIHSREPVGALTCAGRGLSRMATSAFIMAGEAHQARDSRSPPPSLL